MCMRQNKKQGTKGGREARRKEGKKWKKEFQFIFKCNFNLEGFQFLKGVS